MGKNQFSTQIFVWKVMGKNIADGILHALNVKFNYVIITKICGEIVLLEYTKYIFIVLLFEKYSMIN